jgi:hypothetical protein
MSRGDTKDGDTTGVGSTATSPLQRSTRGWLDHLRIERGAADNTLTSYQRDLTRYELFLDGRGIHDPAAVREADVSEDSRTTTALGVLGCPDPGRGARISQVPGA